MTAENSLIIRIGEICSDKRSPIMEFYEELGNLEFAELCIFSFCYSWFFILDWDLMEPNEDNIGKYQLYCNILLKKNSGIEIELVEFMLMFRERYLSYRDEYDNYVDNSEFPKYFYLRLFKFPLENNEIKMELEYYLNDDEYVDERELEFNYGNHINYLLNKLQKLK